MLLFRDLLGAGEYSAQIWDIFIILLHATQHSWVLPKNLANRSSVGHHWGVQMQPCRSVKGSSGISLPLSLPKASSTMAT